MDNYYVYVYIDPRNLEELDRKCEEFTSVETLIGDFVIVSSPDA